MTLTGENPTINAGSGKPFTVKAERIDNFNGPIRVDIDGRAAGLSGHDAARHPGGAVRGARRDQCPAPMPPRRPRSSSRRSRSPPPPPSAARSGRKDVNSFGTIKLADKPKVIVHLEPAISRDQTWSRRSGSMQLTGTSLPRKVTIAPGGTVTCKLRVERNGFDDRIAFDVANLPHGVIVDDIGLSGVLIPEKQTERTIFLRAEPWVPEQTRTFFATAQVEGNQVSLPLVLRVETSSGK